MVCAPAASASSSSPSDSRTQMHCIAHYSRRTFRASRVTLGTPGKNPGHGVFGSGCIISRSPRDQLVRTACRRNYCMAWETWEISSPERKLFLITCTALWFGVFLLAAHSLDMTVPYLPLAF